MEHAVKDTLRSYIMEHFEIPADDPDFGDDVHLFDYGFVDSWAPPRSSSSWRTPITWRSPRRTLSSTP